MDEENLNTILESLNSGNSDIVHNALSMLIDMVKSSHSGSISTLNFQTLFDKKNILLDLSKKLSNEDSKKIHDIISAVSIMGNDDDLLKHRILGNIIPLKEWGHLYVKKLVGCIIDSKLNKNEVDFSLTTEVSNSCADFLFKNNLEFDAIDFLIETENIFSILDYVEEHNYKRVILYLEEMSSFYELYDILNKIYLKMGDHSRYIVHIIDNGYYENAIEYVENMRNENIKYQLLYILGRLNIYYDNKNLKEKFILSNQHIKDIYRSLIKIYELDSEKSKVSTLRKLRYDKDLKGIQQHSFNPITVCNGFINLGYGQDNIFFPQEGDETTGIDYQTILDSNIPELITIIGSVGCIEFWNPTKVLELLQEHIFGEFSLKRTGSLLALAISSSRMWDENQTILSLLTNNLNSNDPRHVLPTLLGIQSIYCNTSQEELKILIIPLLYSDNIEISSFAAFTLGSIFIGTPDEELIPIFFQMFTEKEEYSDSHFYKLIMLGLALLFYRRPDVECLLDNVDTNFSKHGSLLIKGFQYLKTGDSQVIEHILSEAFSGDTDALLESIALLSCTLVCLGDELASQMVSRICTSSLLIESPHLKSVLPLCYSLLYPSTPLSSVLDVLERNIHAGDANVVIPSLYALGIVGGGTVSGRIQKIIDSQYSQYYKDPKVSSILRISNGLLSLGKGLSSISFLMYDKTCIAPKNLVGLFATTFLMLDPFSSPLINGHTYLFYLLNQSFIPKYVYTKDKINIRIGLPVNTVGVVGDPRRISSMQTHSTPVILNCTEKAEIDEKSFTPYIEDIVVLNEN